jgi:hypothetical protein
MFYWVWLVRSLELGGVNILRRVPVALWRAVCKCFVKSGLESNRRPIYFTVLDQSIVMPILLHSNGNNGNQ